MHQHRIATDIICVEILNLEVVNEYRIFEQFVLDLLNNDILSVQQLQSVSGAKLNRFCPTFDGNVERVSRRGYDLLSINGQMYQFFGFILKCSDNSFQRGFAGIGIGCPDETPGVEVFNGNKTGFLCTPKGPIFYSKFQNRN